MSGVVYEFDESIWRRGPDEDDLVQVGPRGIVANNIAALILRDLMGVAPTQEAVDAFAEHFAAAFAAGEPIAEEEIDAWAMHYDLELGKQGVYG
jgi:hypothetical protein